MDVNSLARSGENFVSVYFEHVDLGKNFIDEIDELEHHGIKGQRWGLRRYQNEDGSLTEAGIKRYGKGAKSIQDSHDKMQDKIARNAQKKAAKVAAQKAKAKMKTAKEKEKSKKQELKDAKKAQKAEAETAKRKEEFEKHKAEILKDPRKIYKNFDNLTKDEISDALKRFELKEKIHESAKKDLSVGAEYLESLMKYANVGVKMYNYAAGIANAKRLYDAPTNSNKVFPYINIPGGGGNNKKKKK